MAQAEEVWPKRYTGSMGHPLLNGNKPLTIDIVMHAGSSGEWKYLDSEKRITVEWHGRRIRMTDADMELSGELNGQRIMGSVIRDGDRSGAFGVVLEELKVGNYIVYTGEKYQVGHGTFGSVHFCRHEQDRPLSDEVKYVAKLVPLKPGWAKHVEQEADILSEMSKLHHPNILHMKDFAMDKEDVIFVLPFMRCGNLRQVLARIDAEASGIFSAPEVSHTFRQVLCAVEFLHGQKITHRDLKPENILVSHYDRQCDSWILFVKISDFGCSKIGDIEPDTASGNPSLVGTKPYMAPEIYRRIKSVGYDLDYWSLGIILYYLLNFRNGVPFPTCSEKRTYPFMLSEERLSSEIKANVPEGALHDIVSGLLQVQTCNRWTATQARQVLDERATFPRVQMTIDCVDTSDSRVCRERSDEDMAREIQARYQAGIRSEPQEGANLTEDDAKLAQHLQVEEDENLAHKLEKESQQLLEDGHLAHELERKTQRKARSCSSTSSRSRSRSATRRAREILKMTKIAQTGLKHLFPQGERPSWFNFLDIASDSDD